MNVRMAFRTEVSSSAMRMRLGMAKTEEKRSTARGAKLQFYRVMLQAASHFLCRTSYNGIDAFNLVYYEGPRDCSFILDGCGSLRHGRHATRARRDGTFDY